MPVSNTRRRTTGPVALIATAVAAATLLTACGSNSSTTATSAPSASSSSSSAALSEAKRAFAASTRPATWKAPGPAFTLGNALKGKTIAYIANGLSFPFSQSVVAGFKQAASAAGAKTFVTDGAGQTAKASGLVQQAVGQKVAAIVIQGFLPDQLAASIGAAKAAGIPVVLTAGQDPHAVTPAESKIGVSAIATQCFSCAGKAVADYVASDSGGKAKVVVFNVPDIAESSKAELGAFKAELTRVCPDCKVTVKDAPLAQWVSGLPQLTSSALKSDPTVNYLFPLYDGMVASMKGAVASAAAADRVKIVSYNGNKPNLAAIQKADIEALDVGQASSWLGWANVDQVARLVTKNPPAADENVPNRSFDKSVVDSIDLSKSDSTWYGNTDFVAAYRKLWGLTG
jgi:ribose transport system substrate-binding protein